MKTEETAMSGGTPTPDKSLAKLRTVAWLRATAAVLCGLAAAGALIQGAILTSHGCMDRMAGGFLTWFVGVPLAVLAVTSACIAVGLFQNSVSAAVILDTAVFLVITAGLILMNAHFLRHGDHGDMGERLRIGMIAAAVALAFAGEMAWLLRASRGRKTACRDLGVLAAALALVVIVWPLVSRQLHVRHVRALREFVAQRLIAIPPEAPITASRKTGRGGGHADCIAFRSGSAIWSATAEHDRSGWRFMPGKARSAAHANSNWGTNITSSAAAFGYLRSAGVLASNIGTNCTAIRETAPPNRTFYTIDSPALNGSFEISQFGAVELYLSKPLDTPQM